MTLATHAIIGAAAASVAPANIALAFIYAFASHFLIDAIPHWDYRLRSKTKNEDDPLQEDMAIGRAFFVDCLKIGGDALFGAAFVLFFFRPFSQPFQSVIFAGILGGILPDGLQFLYYKFRREPLYSLQRFHIRIHAKKRLRNRPVLGIALQTALVIAVLSALSLAG